MKALKLATCALLAGCAGSPQLQTERTYQIQWIGEQPRLENAQVSLTLGADGRAYGSTGCNHWFASYQLEGKQLHFSNAGSTRRLCQPLLQEQEQRFLASLGAVQRWKHGDGEEIRLLAEGQPSLRMNPME